jgi:hypothetical protein
MRRSAIRTFSGIVTFTLPALVAVIGVSLDDSTPQHDPRYAALIPVVLWSSVVLAALVPAGLIMTSTLSWPRRVGMTVAMLCVLVLECGLTGYIVLMRGLR